MQRTEDNAVHGGGPATVEDGSGRGEPATVMEPQPKGPVRGGEGSSADAESRGNTDGSMFQLLADHAGVGLFLWDSGRLCYANEALGRICGRSLADLRGLEGLVGWVEPSDRECVEHTVREALEGPAGRASCEAKVAAPSGAAAHVEIHLRRRVYRGRPVLLGTVVDVTERRQAEERLANERAVLRTLVDHLPVAIYLKDTATRKTLVNPVDQRNLGVRSEAEALGRTDFEFFPREQAEAFYADDMQVLTTGVPVLNREERISRPDGTHGWLLTSKVPLRDVSGRIVGLAGIGLDITDRKLADEKLRAFAAQLERSNRELQDFAYVASHDLQEPLRKIIVFSERLCERCAEALPAEGRDYLERMRRAAQRMQTLINDLLTYSRVTTRARQFEPVDLRQVIREVLTDLEARIEQSGGSVEVGELPVLEADPTQMRQLFQNLLGNALKFRKPEIPPRVRVWSERFEGRRPERGPQASPEAFCRIYVEDNGIGFDEKYLDRIFNVFQRLHGRGQYEGSGIGLAIARKIVQRHGGEITARSQPGRGATFLVTLPLHQPQPH